MPNNPNSLTASRASAFLLLLNGPEVQKLQTTEATTEAVREALQLQASGGGRLFAVVREQLQAGVFGIKSGDVQAEGLLGFKAAGFWPSNRAGGSEPHQATIMLVDPSTGRPTCVLDGNAITTMRTGAAGGIGLSLLARQESRSLCVFGTGVQARVQVQFAISSLPNLAEVQYLSFDRAPDSTFESACKESAFQQGRSIQVRHAINADDAVYQSDVVITATPGGGPLFQMDAVRPGTHINAVGTDTRGKRELPAHLLEKARVFVDDSVQSRSIGEMQWVAPDVLCTEIGTLLLQAVALDRSAEDITVFDMTGLALQDLLAARAVYRAAEQQGVGTRLAWPW